MKTERDPNFALGESFRVGAKHSQMGAVTFTLALQRHDLFYESPGYEESNLYIALQASELSCLD